MVIRLTIPQFLQPLTDGASTIQVNGSTVGDCLGYLIERFPDLETELYDEHGQVLCPGCLFRINDEVAYLDTDTLDKPVKDGDKLSIIPIIGGG